MKTRMISAVMAAFMLAAASVGGITASAEEGTAETTETTASEPADESSDDMEKFREVMSELAEAETNDVAPDYDGDPYYDTDGNATLIKSEQIIYNTEEMQFIAVTTKDGHVFYVLINYTAGNGEDNVYFLNKVDDYDLYALLYAGDEDDDEKDKITPEQAAQEAEKANGRVQSGDSNDVDYAEDTAEDGEESSESAAQAKSVPMNKNSMILVQPQYSPMRVEDEIAVIYCGTKGLLRNVPLDKVAEFEKVFLQILKTKYKTEVLDELRAGKLTEEMEKILQDVAADVANRFKA